MTKKSVMDSDAVLGNLKEPVFAVEPDGTVAFVTDRFLSITQRSREDLLGARYTVVEPFVEEGFEALGAGIEAVAGGETDERRVEVLMRHPEAAPVPRRLPAEARITAIHDDGARLGAVVVFRNISQRKDRERRLRRSQRQFDAVFDSPDSFIGVLEPDGTVRTVNETALAFADADRETVEGKPFWETPWWSHSAELQERLREWIDRAGAGEHVRFEASHYAPDGERVTVDGVIRPVTDDDGTVVSLVAEARDITERKRRERELQRQNERLEEFASIVSHDLRSPLNVAQGRLELAAEECDSDHLERASAAHDRMATLIDDLLTLAREGGPVEETQPVDLAEISEGCWENVVTDEATLVTETRQSVRADPGRLKRLLENLFRNAIDHGGETVTVTVGDLADGNGFYVADDGPGIPPEEREAVFEGGYSTTREGTGIGLHIVEEIAEAHGWTVTVVDGDAGGARFEVTGVERAA